MFNISPLFAEPSFSLARPPLRRISLTSMPSRARPPPLLPHLKHPIVLAPMAGGPSTPTLAAAVSKAGGLGFIASGYLTAQDTAARINETRALCGKAPFGVNVFVPSPAPVLNPALIKRYTESLKADAERLGVPLDTLDGRYDRDEFDEKLALLTAEPVPLVSFAFGCPSKDVVLQLQGKDTEVWITVTSPEEAHEAATVGADALIVQGAEAGGHQSSFKDSNELPLYSLLPLLQLVSRKTSLPLVAAGGIMSGEALSAVLCAGAQAAQMGSAFLCAKEAGTNELLRKAVQSHRKTALTRAFSGRLARGVRNRFMLVHSEDAPLAYPEVNNLTRPLRAAAVKQSDDESINLWAGQAHELAETLPAADIVAKIAASAKAKLDAVAAQLAKK